MAAANVDVAVDVDVAAAAADPIRKFNYICATDTSCYADVVVVSVVVAALGFSKPARRKQSERSAAQRRQRQQRQRRRRSAKKQQIVHAHCYAAALSGAALHVSLCVCVYWCLPAQLRQKCSHSHTYRDTQGGDRPQSFCIKFS